MRAGWYIGPADLTHSLFSSFFHTRNPPSLSHPLPPRTPRASFSPLLPPSPSQALVSQSFPQQLLFSLFFFPESQIPNSLSGHTSKQPRLLLSLSFSLFWAGSPTTTPGCCYRIKRKKEVKPTPFKSHFWLFEAFQTCQETTTSLIRILRQVFSLHHCLANAE